jgi:hypothetical protein
MPDLALILDDDIHHIDTLDIKRLHVKRFGVKAHGQ